MKLPVLPKRQLMTALAEGPLTFADMPCRPLLKCFVHSIEHTTRSILAQAQSEGQLGRVTMIHLSSGRAWRVVETPLSNPPGLGQPLSRQGCPECRQHLSSQPPFML